MAVFEFHADGTTSLRDYTQQELLDRQRAMAKTQARALARSQDALRKATLQQSPTYGAIFPVLTGATEQSLIDWANTTDPKTALAQLAAALSDVVARIAKRRE